MKNQTAISINEKLGVKIFNEEITSNLIINMFSKEDVKRLMIDDLVNESNEATSRLTRFVHEIISKSL